MSLYACEIDQPCQTLAANPEKTVSHSSSFSESDSDDDLYSQ